MKSKINAFLDLVKERNGQEPEFLQAVQEVAEAVIPFNMIFIMEKICY